MISIASARAAASDRSDVRFRTAASMASWRSPWQRAAALR